MKLRPLAPLVILWVLRVGVAILRKVAFFATQETTVCSGTAISRMLLPTFLTRGICIVVGDVLLLGLVLLIPLSPWIPLLFSLVIASWSAGLTRRPSLAFLLR